MHDIDAIRENPDAFDKALGLRGLHNDQSIQSAELIALSDALKSARTEMQEVQTRRKSLANEIRDARIAGDDKRAEGLHAEAVVLRDEDIHLDIKVTRAEKLLKERLAIIPNRPNPDVPKGSDESGNVELRTYSGSRTRLLSGKQHFELGEAFGLMDFEAAARMSGSRFVVLKGQLARLERALGQFMLDLHTGQHGYTEVAPPILVREEAMFGTAQLPKFREDQFLASREATAEEFITASNDFIEKHSAEVEKGILLLRKRGASSEEIKKYREKKLRVSLSRNIVFGDIIDAEFATTQRWQGLERQAAWLIPTAEVPLTNLVRESILSEEELPLRFTALTPCFRAEAGSAGRDTRGMLRQHQFNKVELVSITTPEQSAHEHGHMLGSAEAVLKKLDLPYRVMTLCTGDMGFASQKTYDIEVWMPGQKTYREISSCSTCGDFQARRMKARYRPRGGGSVAEGSVKSGSSKLKKDPIFVHTLNGSGVAVGRALIAVMENYQNPDGSVTIPSVLKPYMGGIEKIEGLKS